MSRLVLASASPRRLELLRQIGLEPEVIPANIDESVPADLDAPDTALHLARQKTEAVARALGESPTATTPGRSGSDPNHRVILGADTVVEVDWQVLGKPTGPDQAAAMLRSLSGRTHHVHTGLWIVAPHVGTGAGGFGATVSTAVTMRDLNPDEIEAYVATGEGSDAAGAYAIQGRAGLFVTSIAGDYSNVVGLPLAVVGDMLAQAGIVVHQHWSSRPATSQPGSAGR